jgi:cholesterol transport system auxiliary component
MKKYRIIYMVSSLLLLVSCTKDPIIKRYTFDIPKVKKTYHSPYKYKVLKVSYPQSLLEVMSQKMNFSYSLNDRGVYLNSQWSNHSSRLLQGTFIGFLEQSHIFRAVLSNNTSIEEDYKLESNIFAFEHRVRAKESFAVVSIQFSLIDTKRGKLVKSKRFSYQQRTQTIDAKGYAKATNVIISRLARDLLGWLR